MKPIIIIIYSLLIVTYCMLTGKFVVTNSIL
jgi:hypothetical protein